MKNAINKCYTCNPSEHVKKHIIGITGNTMFHHDMLKRSMIIATPIQHYHDINDIPKDVFYSTFQDINEFIVSRNIDGYQCIHNTGRWQSHHHFHVKILMDEVAIMKMRERHFNQMYSHPYNKCK